MCSYHRSFITWSHHRNESYNVAFILGATNATAQITLRERQQTPPLRFTDIMSAQVGDKVYQTENQFQQEWLSGKNIYL